MRKRHWKRKWLHFYGQIVNDHGTVAYIARGWTLGVFIGGVMPICSQLMVSIPLSFVFRGSKIGAILGTFWTNPVTIFFIYPVQCWLGNKLIGGDLSQARISEALQNLIKLQSFQSFMDMGLELILSFFAGGLAFALILAPLTYWAVTVMVTRYRAYREKRKAQFSATNRV